MFTAREFAMHGNDKDDDRDDGKPASTDDDNLTRIVSIDDQRTVVVPALDLRSRTARNDDDATRRASHEVTRLSTSTVTRVGQERAHTLSNMLTRGAGPHTGDGEGDVDVKHVGRYAILEKLGRGGMATVFRAHDPDIGRDMAIKFLHSTLCEDEEYRGRFLREARAAGGLSHPNIVTVHDVGEIDGRPFLAMELLEGKPLDAVMEGGKSLPIRDVVIIGMQLARALDYAHSRGVVHRDIKPGNIALAEGTKTIKVMDFGIAHMDMGGAAEQHTRVGDVLGTPQYMSPEQTRGEKLDGRSDLFSVGIILYQMLAGQRPFQAGSIVAVAMKIAQEQPTPLDKLRADVPSSLKRVVERCLAKAPDQRFQTGSELADALSRVLVQLDEAERQRETPRIIPLRVKWAVTMGLIVAVVMGIVATVVVQRQYAAMVDQVAENGAAMVRFIAAKEAEDALSKNWESIDSRVQNMMKTGDFKSIVVVDKQGFVRASDRPADVDQPYRAPASAEVEKRSNGVEFTRIVADGESILDFEAPLMYADVINGRVIVGLREQPLKHVARLSMVLMAVLVVVTVLAVAVAMYFVANWFARPIKTIEGAMDELTRGHLDHRIAETRKDEFGLLFKAFDRMAQALQDARTGVRDSTAVSTIASSPAARPDGTSPPMGMVDDPSIQPTR